MTALGKGDESSVLWDIERIKQLKARYFRFLDRQEWKEIEQLFTPEASFELETPDGWVRFGDRASWLANLSSLLDGGWTVHHGHTPEIEVDGNSAVGTWAMSDLVHLPAASGRPDFMGFGHYEEHYQRVGEDWKIVSLRLTRIWVGPLTIVADRS